METLARNPFTDERLKELLKSELIYRLILDFRDDINDGAEIMLKLLSSLDPFTNPVTKHELRAWLLDNGFEERETDDPIIKSYENKETREKLALVFYGNGAEDWDFEETRTEIEIRARKRNIHPFTLYAEIKLKYGTNNE